MVLMLVWCDTYPPWLHEHNNMTLTLTVWLISQQKHRNHEVHFSQKNDHHNYKLIKIITNIIRAVWTRLKTFKTFNTNNNPTGCEKVSFSIPNTSSIQTGPNIKLLLYFQIFTKHWYPVINSLSKVCWRYWLYYQQGWKVNWR